MERLTFGRERVLSLASSCEVLVMSFRPWRSIGWSKTVNPGSKIQHSFLARKMIPGNYTVTLPVINTVCNLAGTFDILKKKDEHCDLAGATTTTGLIRVLR